MFKYLKYARASNLHWSESRNTYGIELLWNGYPGFVTVILLFNDINGLSA